jgi:hypothetical protein
MNPIGLYLVLTDHQREHGWVSAEERRRHVARADTAPIVEPETGSRIGRLAAVLRRRVARSAGA